MMRWSIPIFFILAISYTNAEEQRPLVEVLESIHNNHGILFSVELLVGGEGGSLLSRKLRYNDLQDLTLVDLRSHLTKSMNIRIDGADHVGAVWRIVENGIVDNPLETVINRIEHKGFLDGLIVLASKKEPSIRPPTAWISGSSFRNQVDSGTEVHIRRSSPIAIHDLFTMGAPRHNSYPILWYARISNPRDRIDDEKDAIALGNEDRFCLVVFCGEIRQPLKSGEK